MNRPLIVSEITSPKAALEPILIRASKHEIVAVSATANTGIEVFESTYHSMLAKL